MGERSKKYKNTFTLIGPSDQYVVTSEDVDVWINQFNKAIISHLEYISVTQDSFLRKEKEANMTFDNPRRYGTYDFPSGESFSGWWLDGKVWILIFDYCYLIFESLRTGFYCGV